MKFEPLVFIKIANRNGITLTRMDDGLMLVKNASPLWMPLLKQHKHQLLKHLPDDESKRLQADIFDQ